MTVKQNAFGGAIQKLSDLQRKKPAVIEGELIQKIDPKLIECKTQIRKKDNPGFTEESLLELGNDIEQNGQGEPAIIRPHPKPESGFNYEMVAGERRLRSCAIKGLLLDCVVRNLTDQQAKRIQRSENVQREGLTQLEIALALKADYDELQTLQAVANEWKKGLNWVAERLKYLEVMERDGAGRAAVEQGLTADVSVVNDLNRLENLDQQAAAQLLARADAEPDLNLRNEVRTSLKHTKSIRTGKPANTKAEPPKKVPTEDDPLTRLNELVAVQAAQIKTHEETIAYLTSELQEARNKLAGDWKPQ